MLLYNVSYDANILMFSYMFIYNLSLIALFWTLFTTKISSFKTLYSFNSYSYYSFQLTLITVILFSMAGVPPFIGFFSKLFILTLVTNNSFFLIYSLFFVILFLGLYFYVQNIRFLFSTNYNDRGSINLDNERLHTQYYYFTLNLLFIITLGIFFIDDIIILFT